MGKIEELIKRYLEDNISLKKNNKTADCIKEQVLLEYLEGALNKEKSQVLEYHLADCGFCLSQLNIAFESKSMSKKKDLEAPPQKLIDKTRSLLGIYEDRKGFSTKLFLAGAIVFFILSFAVPKYFIQFLVATLILGIRWAFESEGGRTLIMVLDSWRRHSHDKDDEISRHIKNRL